METTLGKRIAAGRKKMGLTQDQLAERLGVTAQAVSKWENDQSCPDITMLPKLAEIFGTTTDALLGMENEQVHEAEVVSSKQETAGTGFDYENGTMEFHYNSGRTNSAGFALWVLLAGGLMLTASILHWDVELWDVLWSSGLMMFGLFGLYPRFSFLRLGCTLFGGYYLLGNFYRFPFDKGFLLPLLLVLLGLSLLVDALRKPKKPHFSINHVNKRDSDRQKSSFRCDGEHFNCSTSFGERHHRIDLEKLSGGQASVSFGELDLDLTAVREFAPDCRLDLSCSFGELEVLVPRTCRVRHDASSSFGAVEFKGSPSSDARDELFLNCDVSFGSICIKYI